jgi:hypothetical protein
MFVLRAPYPDVQATVILPSPIFGDSKANVATVKIIHSMDGTRYTYKQPKDGRKTFQWDFKISRNKALELQAFIKVYNRFKIQTIDYNSDKRVGYLINNPFEYTGAGKAEGFPGNELMEITLSFEEE